MILKVFLHEWIIFSVITLISFGCDRASYRSGWEHLEWIGPALALSFVIAILITLFYVGDSVEWNDGFCPECNVPWEFVGVERGYKRVLTDYYYCCPNCKDMIEVIFKF